MCFELQKGKEIMKYAANCVISTVHIQIEPITKISYNFVTWPGLGYVHNAVDS